MSAIRLAGFELRRQKRPLQVMAVIFLLLLPLLYGALYLWSSWDPYGKLDKIPAAVVDLDRPVEVDGRSVAAGREFVAQLKADPVFDWHFTDAANASHGLSDGDFLIVLTIPSSFSANLTAAAGSSPREAQVEMRVDDSNGYLVNVIAESARSELNLRVDQAATTAYFETVYRKLDTLRTDVAKAQAGAGRLAAGTTKAARGTATLTSGLVRLDRGSGELVTGSARLERGAAQVAQGNQRIAEVAVPVLNDLSRGLPRLARGGEALTADAAALTRAVANGANDLGDRQARLEATLARLARENPDLADSGAFDALEGAVSSSASGVERAAQATRDVATSAAQVAGAARAAARDVPAAQRTLDQSANDLTRLARGSREVAQGTARLNTGARKLDRGLRRATTGARELRSGARKLDTGARQLDTGLTRIVQALPSLSAEQRSKDAAILGAPTEVALVADNPAGVYGRGLAPFFFAIALWVVGLAAFLVFRPVNARALAIHGARSLTVSIAGWLPVMVVGVLGGLILLTVTTIGLGLDPVHLAATIAVVAITAASFTAIAHAFRLAWGVVGSAVVLVLLMVQLTSCGGLYPIETLPEPLRWAHPLLPMTYVVNGLRVTFTGGDLSRLWTDLSVIGGYGLVALVVSWYLVHRKRTWTPGQRDPAIPEAT